LAVAPIAVEGQLAAAARAEIEAGLASALQRARFDVVTARMSPDAFPAKPCTDAACVLEVAKATKATYVLQVWISQDGRDYEVRTVVWHARDGSEAAKVKQNCDICGVAELVELIADQSTSLRDKLGTLPATLSVATRPAGALVKIDGKVVGVSPIVETLVPGPYTVMVEKAGFLARERKVQLVEAGDESIDLELQPLADARAATEDAPRKRDVTGIVGWTSFAIGLGALGAGIPLLVLHHRPVKNRCTDEFIDENGVCRYRHDTVVPGAVLAAVGGALLVTGIALVVVHAKRKRSRDAGRAQALVGPSGFGLGLRF
jgi:hypothetical protein